MFEWNASKFATFWKKKTQIVFFFLFEQHMINLEFSISKIIANFEAFY